MYIYTYYNLIVFSKNEGHPKKTGLFGMSARLVSHVQIYQYATNGLTACSQPCPSMLHVYTYIYIYIHNMHLDIQKKLIHTKTSQNIYQHPMCDRLLLIKIDLYPFHHYSNKKTPPLSQRRRRSRARLDRHLSLSNRKRYLLSAEQGFVTSNSGDFSGIYSVKLDIIL